MSNRYVFDTSAFIEAWHKHLPYDMSEAVWGGFDELIAKGRLMCPREVYRELEVQDDDLFRWVTARRKCLVREPTTDVQVKLAEIVNRYPGVLALKAKRHLGDPWVIAHAVCENALVVTYEEPVLVRSATVRKIPDICQEVGISWCTPLDVLRAEGWRLLLSR